jgi:hypothetical protein
VKNPEELFHLGAVAAGKAGRCSPRYVCPLCLDSHFAYDPKVLTREHVPAAALTGAVLVLTCNQCNSEGGHQLQASQVEREREEAFWAGASGPARNLEFLTQQGVVRGEAVADESGNLRFTFHPHRMAPETLEALKGLVRIEGRVHRQGRGFDWQKARLADLRDAYLWVFAHFGYSLVANEAYNWARRAIREGRTSNTKWAIRMDDPFTVVVQKRAGRPVILVTAEPKGVLVVANGRRGCILPTPFNNDPYSSFGDRAVISFLPRAIPVPRQPRFAWDFLSRADGKDS